MKDRIYRHKKEFLPDFDFNQEVADVFDDMVTRSIPFYHQTNWLLQEVLIQTLPQGGRVYDLGCSTGNLLFSLTQNQVLQSKECQFIGLDRSPGMIEKCRSKIPSGVEFHCQDLLDADLQECEAIILNYTLQFLPHSQKLPLLQKIYAALKPGGIVILCEKTQGSSPWFEDLFTHLYYDFKRENGYSDLEICQKREALENVLLPLTTAGLSTLLQDAGFRHWDMFFRWHLFAGFIGKKS